VEQAQGSLNVEGYVVRHDRNGQPEKGTVLGRLTDGKRALAHIDATPVALAQMEEVELVGRTGEVRFDQGLLRNLVSFPEFS